MDLHRVGERQVADVVLDVDRPEDRPVDVADVHRQVEVLGQVAVVGVDDRAERHERQRHLVVGAQAREAAGELDVVRLGSQHERRELAHLHRQAVGGALDRREARDRELAGVGAREAGVRVPVRVVPDAHGDVVGRAAEDVGDDLRGRRLVPLPLRRRAERDHDLAEDVELDRRDLVVARELQRRVDVLRLGEVVRARVERRADAEAEQLAARLGVGAPRLDGVVADQLEREVERARVVARVVDAAARRRVRHLLGLDVVELAQRDRIEVELVRDDVDDALASARGAACASSRGWARPAPCW